MRFLMNFGGVWGGFWEGFGRGLGVSWCLLGYFLVSFFRASHIQQHNLTNVGLIRGLGGSQGGFWFHFGGFGMGLGRILGRFWENLERRNCSASWGTFWYHFLGLPTFSNTTWQMWDSSGVLEGPRVDFEFILEGFGQDSIIWDRIAIISTSLKIAWDAWYRRR